MRIIAIDPSTKAVGYAIFYDNVLVAAGSCTSVRKERLARTVEIALKFQGVLDQYTPDCAAFEDPLLKGRANNAIQRIIGALELSLFNYGIKFDKVNYYNPGTVKKAVTGDGRADKFEVAISAGEKFETAKEQEILAKMIDEEDFDACDAVAVGLTHLEVK